MCHLRLPETCRLALTCLRLTLTQGRNLSFIPAISHSLTSIYLAGRMCVLSNTDVVFALAAQ